LEVQANKLENMDRERVEAIATKLEIKFTEETTIEELCTAIRASKKKIDKTIKSHPVFGEYKKVTVYPTEEAQKKTSIFVSINLSTFEFQPEIEVELPVGVIDFIKSSYYIKHEFDETAVSANGNIGAHVEKQVRKYVVELS